MSKLVNLTMFRGYVNKVLPTVYDDSLSYYEVLAKVMEKINEIINLDNAQNEIINNIPEDVSEFAEDLAQFKSSMTQQFNDFKTEINADFNAFEAEVNAKVAADSTPTQGSTKLITSGGVYASLQDIINSLVKDARPTEDSTNYVTSGGVWKAINDAVEALEATLATKQNALTWDTTPTANSTNPVQSGGIKSYVDNAAQSVQNNLDSYITNNNNRVSGIEGDITDLETGKQDALTFDLAPTLGSNNPVTSNGIAQAIAAVTPSIEVDPVPTQGSTNTVSSNGVYVAVSDLETELEEGLADKQNTLTWDTTPTKNSQNPVTSGGLFEKFAQIDPYGTVDPEPEQGSPNAVSSGGTWTALQTLNNDLTATIDTKQDILTFDAVPTAGSENPVYSGGVFDALAGKQDTLTFDAVPTEDSENPVYSGGVFAELALKADKSETAEYPIGGSVSGSAVSVTNSAVANVQGLTVYGRSRVSKNLFKGKDGISGNYTMTFNNETNETTINGTSGNGTFTVTLPQLLPAGTYTLSANNPETNGGVALRLVLEDNTTKGTTTLSEINKTNTITTTQAIKAVDVIINGNTATLPISNFKLKIQLELGSTATPYEPYGILSIGDSGELDVQTCGKNLIPSWASGYINTTDGKTVEPNLYWTYTPNYISLDNDSDYVISADITNKAALFYYDATKNFISVSTGIMTSSKQYVIRNVPTQFKYIRLGFNVSGASVPITAESMPTYKVQIELGSSATAYEPYVSTSATVTTGLPLCGIPVTTGETYTDEQGQKWLADTASVEGKVTRCPKIALSTLTWTYDSTNGVWTAPDLASTALYSATAPLLICAEYTVQPYASLTDGGISWDSSGNLVVKTTDSINAPTGDIVYALATPTTQELTTAEKSALLALRTFDSTTIVTITDDPTVNISYLLNTENGEAIAQLEDKINVELENKQGTLTFDNEPTASSTNPVTSGGVYTALSGKQDTLTWDNAPTEDSNNAISSGAVYTAIQSAGGMQRALLYNNTTPLVLPATVTFGSDIRAYDVLQIEYTRLDTAVNDTITPQYIEIPVNTLDTYYTDYSGTYNIGVLLPGIDAEAVFYDINGLFTELTYDQSRSALPTDITLNINRIFGVKYS